VSLSIQALALDPERTKGDQGLGIGHSLSHGARDMLFVQEGQKAQGLRPVISTVRPS